MLVSGSSVMQMPYYTESRWLSRQNVISHAFRMRNEINDFLIAYNERSIELSHDFADPLFIARLSYLCDILAIIDKVNSDPQGTLRTVTQCIQIASRIKKKISERRLAISNGNLEHFPTLLDYKNDLEGSSCEFVRPTIKEEMERHLTDTAEARDTEFTENVPDWMLEPFSVSLAKFPGEATLWITLLSIRASTRLRRMFECTRDSLEFWANI